MVPRRYDLPVSDLPPPQPAPPVQPAWPPAARSTPRQWPVFTFLLVTLLATLAVAIGGWFRPLPNKPPPAPTYTGRQLADAKAKVCAAYELIRKAVVANTSRNGGEDPTAALAVAANARTALYDGGDYLSKVLAEEPATPRELARAVQSLVSSYQQLAIAYMAEVPESEQKAARDAVSDAGTTVYGICK
jgi:hypothetical protein